MIDYKLLPGTIYTDTDSIFTMDTLDSSLIGKELGLMKDELNGLIIERGYFLGIKKYGYIYKDLEGNIIEKSVIAGVKRDSVTFKDVENIFNGETYTQEIENRFYKSLKNLNIRIANTHVTVDNKHDKKLVNNNYLPMNINGLPSISIYSKIKVYLKKLYKFIGNHYK